MNDFRTQDLAKMPISAVTIAVCCGIYVYQRVYNVDLSKVWFSYRDIVSKKEIWRIITSTYTHGSLIHLLMNMFTAFQEGIAFEAQMSMVLFVSYIVFLVVLSGLITVIASAVLKKFSLDRFGDMPAVGYSGVLFGIFALQSLASPFVIVYLLYLIPVPFWTVPFIYLVVMQILVPNASFIGHAAGIAAGYLTHFLRLDTWMQAYALAVIIALIAVITAYSYIKTKDGQRWELPSYASSAGSRRNSTKARIVNGVLIRG